MARRTKIKIQKKSHYVIRDKGGKFRDVQNIGRAISQDRRRRAKHKAKPGQKFAGD